MTKENIKERALELAVRLMAAAISSGRYEIDDIDGKTLEIARLFETYLKSR